MRTIKCSNGSLDDSSVKTVKCGDTDKKCFDNSYKYCNKFTKKQIGFMIAVGIGGLLVTGIVSEIMSIIPVIGSLVAWIIRLALMIITAVIVYIIFENSRAR